jgi:hypothetical protein
VFSFASLKSYYPIKYLLCAKKTARFIKHRADDHLLFETARSAGFLRAKKKAKHSLNEHLTNELTCLTEAASISFYFCDFSDSQLRDQDLASLSSRQKFNIRTQMEAFVTFVRVPAFCVSVMNVHFQSIKQWSNTH